MGALLSRAWNFFWGLFFGSTSCDVVNDPGCFTRKTMDAFAQLHGQSRLNRKQADRLQECFRKYSTETLDFQQVSDAAWKGFAELGILAPGESVNDGGWIEYNPTSLPSIDASLTGNIVIAEPCNAVSNFAYYRAAIEACESRPFSFGKEETTRAVVHTFANLGFGSAYFHSVPEQTSFYTDNRPIDVLALLFHQLAVSSLPYDPLLFDLSEVPRSETSLEAAETLSLSMIFLEQNPSTGWLSALKEMDVPFYELTFSGTILLILNLVFDDATASSVGNTLAELLLSEDSLDLASIQLVPTTARAVTDIQVPLLDRVDLFLKALGTALKLIFALLWQERLLAGSIPIVGTFAANPISNLISQPLVVAMNFLSNSLTRYNREIPLQLAIDVYPGDAKCRASSSPHSKWHEISGNGLNDLFLLARDVDRVLRGGGVSSLSRTEASQIAPGCEILDTDLSDDEAMKAFADCVILSTPGLPCVKTCIQEESAVFVPCMLDCFVNSLI